jgi:hypothetical protein
LENFREGVAGETLCIIADTRGPALCTRFQRSGWEIILMTRMTDGTKTGGRTVAAKRRRLLLASSAVGLGGIAAALFWNGGGDPTRFRLQGQRTSAVRLISCSMTRRRLYRSFGSATAKGSRSRLRTSAARSSSSTSGRPGACRAARDADAPPATACRGRSWIRDRRPVRACPSCPCERYQRLRAE